MKKLISLSLVLLVLFYFLNGKSQNTILNKIEQITNSEPKGGGRNDSQVFDEKNYKNFPSETVEYFKEIALGREYDSDETKIIKWTEDVKIYVDGHTNSILDQELFKIVSELNQIINPINIEIVNNKNESNLYIYFGSYKDFYRIKPNENLDLLESNMGFFRKKKNTGYLYVDVNRTDIEEQKHLLREELTQSLGLFNDSYKYPESIFYQGWTTTTEYAPIDRELIDMLYNN